MLWDVIVLLVGLAGGYAIRPYLDKALFWSKVEEKKLATVLSLVKDDLKKS